MGKWIVAVREGFIEDFEVEADSQDEAEEKALELAKDYTDPIIYDSYPTQEPTKKGNNNE